MAAPVPASSSMVSHFDKRLAIVPAYNEETCISGVVGELHERRPDFDVLVVDDGSTDRTAVRARAAGARVVRCPFNLGIGGAVQTGYAYAAEQGYDVAIQVDGDGQHDAGQIDRLLHHLQCHPELDMVTGSRFLPGGEADGYRSSAPRRLGIRIFARLLSLITGQTVTDPTSGFRMAGRRGIELFARDYPHDYPEVEALLMLHAHRLRSAEIAVRMRPRAGGTSSIRSATSAYYMVKVMLSLFVGLCRARPTVEPGDRAPVTSEHSI